jgi:hypothetical protein
MIDHFSVDLCLHIRIDYVDVANICDSIGMPLDKATIQAGFNFFFILRL